MYISRKEHKTLKYWKKGVATSSCNNICKTAPLTWSKGFVGNPDWVAVEVFFMAGSGFSAALEKNTNIRNYI